MELVSLGKTEVAPSQSITEDLYTRFVSYIDAKPKTIATYQRAVKQFFSFLKAHGITQPTREDVLSFREELKELGRKPTTIQNYITATRLFFSWAAQEGLYPNIADHVKGAKLDRNHKKDYLTSSQVKSVLGKIDRSSLQGLRDYAMLALMITGGLRTIEVSRANIEDLRPVGDCTALFIQGKGRDEKEDYVKVMPAAEEAIREYLKARGKVAPSEPLFASSSNNSQGKSLSTRSVSGIVKSCLKEAGYDSTRLTAHSLRHTAVTLSLLGGESLQKVQQFARHSNIATTMIYAHNLDRAKNTCEATISKAIF